MLIDAFQPGDIVYAPQPILNDGSMPDMAEGQLIAQAGQRGVIINTGYVEAEPHKELVLVRFESHAFKSGLGPAVACWPSELALPQQ